MRDESIEIVPGCKEKAALGRKQVGLIHFAESGIFKLLFMRTWRIIPPNFRRP